MRAAARRNTVAEVLGALLRASTGSMASGLCASRRHGRRAGKRRTSPWYALARGRLASASTCLVSLRCDGTARGGSPQRGVHPAGAHGGLVRPVPGCGRAGKLPQARELADEASALRTAVISARRRRVPSPTRPPARSMPRTGCSTKPKRARACVQSRWRVSGITLADPRGHACAGAGAVD